MAVKCAQCGGVHVYNWTGYEVFDQLNDCKLISEDRFHGVNRPKLRITSGIRTLVPWQIVVLLWTSVTCIKYS